MANLIPNIAKLLGVEIGEDFLIESRNSCRYRLNNTNLEFYDSPSKKWINADGSALLGLLKGKYSIIKLPWKPKYGEKCWTYANTDFMVVRDNKWTPTAINLSLLNNGMFFRTKEEAIKERPRVYKELTGKDWGGE